MASKKRKLQDQDVGGLKYVRTLPPLLERLHDVGIQRDVVGNRDLHMDQYCTLILLWLFSPLVDSLRGLQQASTLDKVRKKFGAGRTRRDRAATEVREDVSKKVIAPGWSCTSVPVNRFAATSTREDRKKRTPRIAAELVAIVARNPPARREAIGGGWQR
jgi:hypothetical protein